MIQNSLNNPLLYVYFVDNRFFSITLISISFLMEHVANWDKLKRVPVYQIRANRSPINTMLSSLVQPNSETFVFNI